jgi:hypothetical protein
MSEKYLKMVRNVGNCNILTAQMVVLNNSHALP